MIDLSFEYIINNIDNIIITKGYKGVELFVDGVKTKIKAYEVKDVINPRGCGDSFRAGFIYAVCHGYDLVKSCMYGNSVASFAIEVFGTQNHKFTMNEVKERVKTIGKISDSL